MESVKVSTEISEITRLLVQDLLLVKNWKRFYHQLGLSGSDGYVWENGLRNGTLSFYQLFECILVTWIATYGNKNINDLCKVLRLLGFLTLAVELEDQFESLEETEEAFTPNCKFCNTAGNEIVQSELKINVVLRRNNICQGQTEYIKATKNGSNEKGIQFNTFDAGNTFQLSPQEIKLPVTHGITALNANFSGRKKELEKLRNCFNSNKNVIFLICGLGGIGKTELCKKFAHTIPTSNGACISRIWLHGETENTLRDSVLELANILGISSKTSAETSAYFNSIVKLIIRNSHRLLVIVDNVDDEYDEVKKIFKSIKNYTGLFIIVTSRTSLLLGTAGEIIKLSVLETNDVIAMLQDSLDNVSESEAIELCNLVNYPLFLQQAIAYIKQQRISSYKTTNYSVSDYVAQFKKQESKPMMLSTKLSEIDHEYNKTTLVVWDMTFAKIDESAIHILHVLAYLEPDQIDINFVQEICEKLYKEIAFQEGFDMLFIYSLVTIESKGLSDQIFSIHPLVQEVIRDKITNLEHPKQLFDAILLVWTKLNHTKFNELKRNDIQHVIRVCNFAFQCKFAESTECFDMLDFLFNKDRIDCAIEFAQILFKNINFPVNYSREEKVELLEKLLLWCFVSGDFGKYNTVTNEVIETGAYEVSDSHYSASAERLQELTNTKALQIVKKHFGNSDKVFFKVNCKIARNLYTNGKFSEAFTLCLQIVSSNCFKQHHHAFKTIDLIRRSRDRKWQKRRSVDMLVNVLQLENINLNENLHEKIKTMVLLAKSLHVNGELKEALDYYRRANDLFKAVFSKSKSFYISKISELTLELTEFSKISKDEILKQFSEVDYAVFSSRGLQRALDIYETYLGDHLLTVKVKNALASKLLTTSEDQCILLCREVLISDHSCEYRSALNTLTKNARFESNKKDVLEELLKTRRITFQSNPNAINQIKELLAEEYENAGELGNALDLFEHVQEYAIKQGGDDEYLKYLCTNIVRIKLRLIVNVTENVPQLSRDKVLRLIENFKNYHTFSLPDLEKVLTYYKTIFGEEHIQTLRVKNATAFNLFSQEKYNESLFLLNEVISSKCIEEVDIAFKIIQYNAVNLYDNDDIKTSIELLKQVLQFVNSDSANYPERKIITCEYLALGYEKTGQFGMELTIQTKLLNAYETMNKNESKWNMNKIEYLKEKIAELNDKIDP